MVARDWGPRLRYSEADLPGKRCGPHEHRDTVHARAGWGWHEGRRARRRTSGPHRARARAGASRGVERGLHRGRRLVPELILAVDVSASNAFRADTQDEGFAAVFIRAAEIAMQSLLELRLREWTTPPIFYIHPRVEHIHGFDFNHLREVVDEGYRATVAALDREEEWPVPGDAGVYPRRAVTVRVQRERCIGCGACLVQAPPGMFVLDAQGKAVVTRPEQEWSPIDGEFIRHCPTYAISARPTAAPRAAGAAG